MPTKTNQNGTAVNFTNTMTHKDYQQQNNLAQRTAAYRIKTVLQLGFDSNAILTPDQLAQLEARFNKGAITPKKAAAKMSVAPSFKLRVTPAKEAIEKVAQIIDELPNTPQLLPIAQPQAVPQQTAQSIEAQVLFFAPLAVNVLSIALTIAGLKMFAGWYGVALGVMFGLSLFAAVVVSRNSQKYDTSTTSLNTVMFLELGACVLHPFTFYTQLPNGNEALRITAACIASVFVAFLSYRAVLIVRDYNGE